MKKTFMKGALILSVAGIIIKLLGAFFRIPLANIIGATGMGYYQTAYPVYVLLLTLSTAGIPTAIARMVSVRTADGNHREAYRIFKLSFILMFAIGIVSCSILFFGSSLIVGFSAEPKAALAMKAIAPALIFVPVMAAFRGYFQGLQDMTPTALSQIFEQLFRVIFGLSLALILVSRGLEYAAAGASFGATAGSIFGLVTIGIVFLRRRGKIHERCDASPGDGIREPARKILGTIILIAIPITIGAAIMPIMSNIDLAIVMRRLVTAGFTKAEANSLYGQLSGFAAPIINFPQVLTQSLAVSMVPAIAAARQEKDENFLRYNVALGMRTAMIIGLPCAAGLFVLAKPIMLLLYPTQVESAISASYCLAILGIGVIFLSSVQTLTGVLQGIGKQLIPVANLAIGAVAKVGITYYLTGIREVNVKGAAIGTVAAYLIASLLNLLAVKKYTGVNFSVSMTYVKPGVSAGAMALIVWCVYHFSKPFAGNAVATLLSIICGIIVYAFMILELKAVTYEEIERIPKGKKIVKILSKFRKNQSH